MSSNEKLSAHTQARKPWLHDILHVFSIVVSRYVVNIAVETAMQLGDGERERERSPNEKFSASTGEALAP